MGVSGKISQRASTGQHWGSGLGLGSGASLTSGPGPGLGRAHYQLAHALIHDKDDAHTRLMSLLIHTGLLPALSSQHYQLLRMTQVYLGGCMGLCTELQKALQRVSGQISCLCYPLMHLLSLPSPHFKLYNVSTPSNNSTNTLVYPRSLPLSLPLSSLPS